MGVIIRRRGRIDWTRWGPGDVSSIGVTDAEEDIVIMSDRIVERIFRRPDGDIIPGTIGRDARLEIEPGIRVLGNREGSRLGEGNGGPRRDYQQHDGQCHRESRGSSHSYPTH